MFALGRTENINPVTAESVRWVRAMLDDSCDGETRVRLLRDAVTRQNQLRLEATAGLGSDRHLLGLACAATELGIDLPAVFTDKVLHRSFNVSVTASTKFSSLGTPVPIQTKFDT